jgi:hypothetical protein
MMLKKYASKHVSIHEILGSHSSEYDEYCCVGCEAMYSGGNNHYYGGTCCPSLHGRRLVKQVPKNC